MAWGPPPIDATATTELGTLGGTTLPEQVITDEALAAHTAAKKPKVHGSHRRPPRWTRLPAVSWDRDRIVVCVCMAVAFASLGTLLLVAVSTDDAPAVRQDGPSPSPSRVVAPVSSRPSVSHRPSRVPERAADPVATPLTKPRPTETWTTRPKASPSTSAPSPSASASPSATATPKPTVTKTATPTPTAEPTVDPTPEIPSPEAETDDDTRSPHPVVGHRSENLSDPSS